MKEDSGRVGFAETGSTSLRSPEPVPVSALSGNDPARGCQCRLCLYDIEFASHLAAVPEEHHAFFEDLKSRWEHADFDATWAQACIGGEEYTVEFCARYDAEKAKITSRHRDSDRSARQGGETRSGSTEGESAGRSEAEVSPK